MNKLSMLSYRMKVRKELLKLPREMVEATLDECKKVLDLTNEKVIYKYEDNWKEYIRKNQWNEIYLFKEDNQMRLF